MPAYLKKILLTTFILLAGVMLLLWTFSTKATTTEEDEKFLQAYIKKWALPDNIDSIRGEFTEEKAFINRIQDSVIHSIQGYNKPIPKEKVGNIRYYFEKKTGACYDRALLMEKLFTRFGFQTRHVFVFFIGEDRSPRATDILRNYLPTHALLEIKTSKGWMVVDTQNAWMGLDNHQNPLPLGALRKQWKSGEQWNLIQTHKMPVYLSSIYQKGYFKFIYGLYSRHGGFLPHRPWVTQVRRWGVPIPDYNLSQLLMNLF